MKMLLVCAVAAELGDRSFPPEIEVLITGIGPVEASYALSRHLATRSALRLTYDLVVNVGIAGAFSTSKLQPGATVLVNQEYYADLGREDGSALQLPQGAALADALSLDFSTVPAFSGFQGAALRLGTTIGAALTSAQVTTTPARAHALERTFPQVLIETMEGFACARVASLFSTPFLGLRGISNLVGQRNSTWDIQAGIAGVHALLDALFAVYALS